MSVYTKQFDRMLITIYRDAAAAEPCSVMFRRLDCLRKTQRLYSSNVSSHVFGRESFACRHIGPDDGEQERMLQELGYQVPSTVLIRVVQPLGATKKKKNFGKNSHYAKNGSRNGTR